MSSHNESDQAQPPLRGTVRDGSSEARQASPFAITQSFQQLHQTYPELAKTLEGQTTELVHLRLDIGALDPFRGLDKLDDKVNRPEPDAPEAGRAPGDATHITPKD